MQQRDNPAWQKSKGSVTNSNFGSILKSKKETSQLMKCDDVSRVQAISWGITNIAEKVKSFETATKMTVREQGCLSLLIKDKTALSTKRINGIHTQLLVKHCFP